MRSILATAVLFAFPVYQTNSTLGLLWDKFYTGVQYVHPSNLQQAATPTQSFTTNNYFNNVNSAQVANQYGGNGGGSQNVEFSANYNPGGTGTGTGTGGKDGKGGKGGKRARLSDQFNFDGQVTVGKHKRKAREFGAYLDKANASYRKGSGCNNCINDALRGKRNGFVNVDRKKSYLVNKKRFGPGQYGDISVAADGAQIVQIPTDPQEFKKLFVIEEVEGQFQVQDVSDELVENQ